MIYLQFQLDLRHMDQKRGSNIVSIGIDLSQFYISVEWDILAVPAVRNEEYFMPQSINVANGLEEDDEDYVDEEDDRKEQKLLTG